MMSRKTCRYCQKRKNKKSFSKHTHQKDKLDSRCKSCVEKGTKLRRKIAKKSPPKTLFCYSCGKKGKTICLDHNHGNRKFRGWLCDPCNTSIGKLGDNITGVANAFHYMLTTEKDFSEQEIVVLEILKTILATKLSQIKLKQVKKVIDNADTV